MQKSDCGLQYQPFLSGLWSCVGDFIMTLCPFSQKQKYDISIFWFTWHKVQKILPKIQESQCIDPIEPEIVCFMLNAKYNCDFCPPSFKVTLTFQIIIIALWLCYCCLFFLHLCAMVQLAESSKIQCRNKQEATEVDPFFLIVL